MPRNYLPFAKQSQITVANTARAATMISDLSGGGGLRCHCQDLSIICDNSANVRARIGITRLGYLTESFYEIPTLCDDIHHENHVWHFVKPYTIRQGQRLRASILYPAAFADVATPGIAFSGRRVQDDMPITLYDNSGVQAVAGVGYNLNGETLQCPADSEVELYSMTPTPNTGRYGSLGGGEQLMVWGPDDRQWWGSQLWPFVVTPLTAVNLNRPEWILDPTESITVEYWNNSGGPVNIWTTLRGSIEVEI